MKPKRFYQDVSLREEKGGFGISLDGRVLKTVAKQPLVLPKRELAELVAAEWRAQGEVIEAERMIATRLANILLDRVSKDRVAIAQDMLLFAETDLLCHRAREPELAALQAQHWDGVLMFLRETLSVHMVLAKGVVPVAQPEASLAAIRAAVEGARPEEFVALALITPLLGSILLTLALWKKGIALDVALSAAHVDEDYQQAKWGKDEEASRAWEAKARELSAAVGWLMVASASVVAPKAEAQPADIIDESLAVNKA